MQWAAHSRGTFCAFAWRAAFQECNLAGGGAASIVVYRVAQTLFEGLKLPLSATVEFAVPFEAFSKGMVLRISTSGTIRIEAGQ
jgi:hypothetical protein